MDSVWFWVATLLYCAAMIWIGYMIARNYKKKGLSQLEFWIAQRQLPSWWLAASLTAGWLMLGWIGFGMSQVYMYGATGLWILPIPWFILCIIIILAAPLYRKIGAVSLPQMIEKRFGKSARPLLAVFSFFVFIIWTEAEIFMAGTLLSPFLGIDPKLCMLLVAIPVVIYTYLGGFRAVVTTDVYQFSIMAVFMIILAVTAIVSAVNVTGSNVISALVNTATPWAGPGNTFNLGFLGWLFPLILLIGYLPGWLIEQDLSIRMQAAKSTKDARKAAWLGFLLIGVFVIILPAIVAFCSLVVYPPDAAGVNAAIGPNALGIISAFIGKLPVWLAAFMVVGILASQMSTIDTFANVSAMPIAYDIIDPILARKKVADVVRTNMSKIVSAVVIMVALLLSFISESLNDVYYISSGVLSASIAVQVMFIFWKRTTLPAIITSSVVGFVGTVGGYFLEYKIANAIDYLPGPFKQSFGYNYIAFGVLLSVIVIIAVSLATKPTPKELLDNVKNKPVDDYNEFAKSAVN